MAVKFPNELFERSAADPFQWYRGSEAVPQQFCTQLLNNGGEPNRGVS